MTEALGIRQAFNEASLRRRVYSVHPVTVRKYVRLVGEATRNARFVPGYKKVEVSKKDLTLIATLYVEYNVRKHQEDKA